MKNIIIAIISFFFLNIANAEVVLWNDFTAEFSQSSDGKEVKIKAPVNTLEKVEHAPQPGEYILKDPKVAEKYLISIKREINFFEAIMLWITGLMVISLIMALIRRSL